jgi:hypothetical protein
MATTRPKPERASEETLRSQVIAERYLARYSIASEATLLTQESDSDRFRRIRNDLRHYDVCVRTYTFQEVQEEPSQNSECKENEKNKQKSYS